MYNAWLINEQTNTSYQIMHESTTIGRAMGNTIVLNDPTVSAQHARLVHQNRTFVLYDLGARVPIRVNGYVMESPTMLQNQDLITLGETNFRFVTHY